jgi:hypothetical protein
MFVLVSAAAGRPLVEFQDVGNLRQLHVEFRQVDDSTAAAALAAGGFGAVEGGHAWLEIGALRGGGSGSADWQDGFEAMLGYARRNGWVDQAGTRVRAHIVRT